MALAFVNRWARPTLAGLLALLLCAAPGPALGATRPSEYEVKAAFLYNFAKFVEWPASAFDATNGDFVIGVLGEDPFGPGLDALLAGKTVQERPLVVRHFKGPEDLGPCEMLFISQKDSALLGRVLNEVAREPVLTVSDGGRFVQRGGMIGFQLDANRVRFSVNLASTREAGLQISSQLLKVAKSVRGKRARAPLD